MMATRCCATYFSNDLVHTLRLIDALLCRVVILSMVREACIERCGAVDIFRGASCAMIALMFSCVARILCSCVIGAPLRHHQRQRTMR